MIEWVSACGWAATAASTASRGRVTRRATPRSLCSKSAVPGTARSFPRNLEPINLCHGARRRRAATRQNGSASDRGPLRRGVAVNATVAVTTFLAAAIEVIEMVAIVVAVGSTRSWRAALAGAGGGLVGLAVLVAVFGTALRHVPLAPIRLVVGALLLVFGLQWLRKGVLRVALQGWAVGQGEEHVD